MKKLVVLLLFLAGCASFNMPEVFEYQIYHENGFDISVWKKITAPQGVYHIYIEGDGHAFNAQGMPTNDPTPKSSLVRQMAAKDSFANVIYLARPCQFTKGSACAKKYWTTERFSPDVVEAEYQVIQKITKRAPVVLIGFSGGAQIAGLLAVTKDLNVKKVITVAGNLDHKAWTAYHHLPELSGSLNLADFKDQFFLVDQVHYAGAQDKVIPLVLTKQFVGDKAPVHIVDKATHGQGWDNIKLFDNGNQ